MDAYQQFFLNFRIPNNFKIKCVEIFSIFGIPNVWNYYGTTHKIKIDLLIIKASRIHISFIISYKEISLFRICLRGIY